MQHNIEIKVEKQGEITIFDIRGELTSFSETPLNEAYQKANNQDARRILLKLEEDVYINSGGIALLLRLMVIGMVGLTEFAKIYDTMEAALEAMATEQQ
jgi:anti-anti-sigma regulatory factor